jgi:hypothetical protein
LAIFFVKLKPNFFLIAASSGAVLFVFAYIDAASGDILPGSLFIGLIIFLGEEIGFFDTPSILDI